MQYVTLSPLRTFPPDLSYQETYSYNAHVFSVHKMKLIAIEIELLGEHTQEVDIKSNFWTEIS